MRLLCQLSVHLFILLLFCSNHGCKPQGQGDDCPHNLEWGMLMQIVSPDFHNLPKHAISSYFFRGGASPLPVDPTKPSGSTSVHPESQPHWRLCYYPAYWHCRASKTVWRSFRRESLDGSGKVEAQWWMMSPAGVRAWSSDLCFDTVDPLIPRRSLRRIWPSVDYLCSRRPTNQELSCECVWLSTQSVAYRRYRLQLSKHLYLSVRPYVCVHVCPTMSECSILVVAYWRCWS